MTSFPGQDFLSKVPVTLGSVNGQQLTDISAIVHGSHFTVLKIRDLGRTGFMG